MITQNIVSNTTKYFIFYNTTILLFYSLSFINIIQYLFLTFLYLHIYNINNLSYITNLHNINTIKQLLQIRIYPNKQYIMSLTYNIQSRQNNRNIRMCINNWILNINTTKTQTNNITQYIAPNTYNYLIYREGFIGACINSLFLSFKRTNNTIKLINKYSNIILKKCSVELHKIVKTNIQKFKHKLYLLSLYIKYFVYCSLSILLIYLIFKLSNTSSYNYHYIKLELIN